MPTTTQGKSVPTRFTSVAVTLVGVVVGLVTGVGVGVVAVVGGVLRPRLRIRNPSRASPSARSPRAITGASRLLPAAVRDDYYEEWSAWMLDLRAAGTPRVRRWMELHSLILNAPRLAITLRLSADRAVDR